MKLHIHSLRLSGYFPHIRQGRGCACFEVQMTSERFLYEPGETHHSAMTDGKNMLREFTGLHDHLGRHVLLLLTVSSGI